MVQIIPEYRRPSVSEKFGQAFSGLGQSLAQDIPQELFSQKEAKAFKERFGKDISGFRDPKMRQDILKSELETEAAKAKREQQQAVLEKFLGSEETQGFSDWEKQLITGEALGLIPSGTGKVLADMRRQREGRDFISQLFGEDSGETGMQPSMPDMGMEDSSALPQETPTGRIPTESSSQKGAIPQSKLQKIPDAKLMQMIGMGGDTAKVAQAEIDRRNKEKEFEFKAGKENRAEKEFAHKETLDFAKDVSANADKGREIISAGNEIKKALKKGTSGPKARNLAYTYLKNKNSPFADLFLNEDMQQLISNTKTFAGGFTGLFGKQPTQREFFWYETILPGILKDVLSNEKSVDYFTKFADLAVKKQEIYDDIVKKNDGYRPLDIDVKVREKLKPYADKLIAEGEELADYVLMKAPDGSIRQVPKSQAESYKRAGLEPIS